jgi:hypothetical protein
MEMKKLALPPVCCFTARRTFFAPDFAHAGGGFAPA